MHADLARRRRAGVTRRRAVRLVVACSTAALARCGHLQGGPTRLVGVTLLEREHSGLLCRGLLHLLRVAAQRDRLVPRRAVKVDDEDIGLVTQPSFGAARTLDEVFEGSRPLVQRRDQRREVHAIRLPVEHIYCRLA